MGLFDNMKVMKIANKGYKLHSEGNKLFDADKYEEGRKKHAEALKYYDEAYQMGVSNVNILMAYGILLLRDGQFEKAKEVFLKVHYTPGLSPQYRFQLRINYSVCLWKLGKIDEAISTIRRAATDGKTTSIYTTLGLFLIEKAEQTGDFEEAIAFNNEAYEYDDEDAVILDNMGQLHYVISAALCRKGDSEKAAEEKKLAVEYFVRAHKIRPKQTTTLYYLGRLHHENGDDEKARPYLEKALEGNFSCISPVSREMVESLLGELSK